MIKAEEIDDFYRIPVDNRNLNYNEYYTEGKNLDFVEDYNSNNTKQLNVNEMYDLLIQLPFIKLALKSIY